MTSYHEDFWNPGRVRFFAVVGFLALFLGGMYLRFGEAPAAPPQPPRPKLSSVVGIQTMQDLDYSPQIYRAQLDEDATQLKVARVTPEDLSGVLAHEVVLLNKPLPTGATVETKTLRLTAVTSDEIASSMGGGIATEHIGLKIENKTDQPLAYRVDTMIPGISAKHCLSKSDAQHNAIALPPRGSVVRTECTGKGADSFMIQLVETVALPEISFYYVSALVPAHTGLEPRPTRGHRPPNGQAACKDIPEQLIRRGMEQQKVMWFDVIDYYARHSCHKFIFPVGYKAFTKPSDWTLPVSAASVKSRP
jgi:hypothetical protein